MDISVVSYPQLNKASDRKKMLRELKKVAYNKIDNGKGTLKSYSEVVANIARKLRSG